MGIGSRLKRAVKKAVKNPLELTGVGLLNTGVDEGLRATTGSDLTGSYQNLNGHTAKAAEDRRVAEKTAAIKALAQGNQDVSTDTADVILGTTADTAGASLDTLRKKKTTGTVSSQLGIV